MALLTHSNAFQILIRYRVHESFTLASCSKLKKMSTIGTVIAGILSALKAVYTKQEVPLKTIVAALLLYGVKEFLNDIVFSCPEQNYESYGWLFIFGPTILLFCLSLMASESFWHLITGCGLLSCGRRRLVWSKARNSIYVASMPPVIWLIYAFVEEDYYVCAKLGPLAAALSKANGTAEKEAVNKNYEKLKTDSQVIAWGMVIGFAVLATVFVTIHRIFIRVDAKLQGTNDYSQYEADKAVQLFNERIQPLAEEEAKKVIDSFFDKNKDKDPEAQIKLGERYLRSLYPQNSGVVNGKVSAKEEEKSSGPKKIGVEGGESIPLNPLT